MSAVEVERDEEAVHPAQMLGVAAIPARRLHAALLVLLICVPARNGSHEPRTVSRPFAGRAERGCHSTPDSGPLKTSGLSRLRVSGPVPRPGGWPLASGEACQRSQSLSAIVELNKRPWATSLLSRAIGSHLALFHGISGASIQSFATRIGPPPDFISVPPEVRGGRVGLDSMIGFLGDELLIMQLSVPSAM